MTTLFDMQAEDVEQAKEEAARVDVLIQNMESQIRDLRTFKAWVLDYARHRAERIDALIGIPAPAVPAPIAPAPEAARD